MKTWSMAINEGEGDIDVMPAALAKSLIPAKLGTKNPLRENAAKALDTVAAAENHPVTVPPSATLPGPMPPYYHLPPQYYSAYNGPYQLGYSQLPQQVVPSPKRPQHHSSSLPSEFDSYIDKLSDYIA